RGRDRVEHVRGLHGSVAPTRFGDAVRALGLLAGGVGALGRAGDDAAGVDDEVAVVVDRHGEAVHATGGGTALVLADPVVLRAVAAALEPLGGDALGHPAPEVGAGLPEGDEPGPHALELGLGVDLL